MRSTSARSSSVSTQPSRRLLASTCSGLLAPGDHRRHQGVLRQPRQRQLHDVVAPVPGEPLELAGHPDLVVGVEALGDGRVPACPATALGHRILGRVLAGQHAELQREVRHQRRTGRRAGGEGAVGLRGAGHDAVAVLDGAERRPALALGDLEGRQELVGGEVRAAQLAHLARSDQLVRARRGCPPAACRDRSSAAGSGRCSRRRGGRGSARPRCGPRPGRPATRPPSPLPRAPNLVAITTRSRRLPSARPRNCSDWPLP